MNNLATVQPFNRPRRVKLGRLFVNGRQGDCWRYAAKEAQAWMGTGSPRPMLRVVHGVVGPLWCGHAWIERGGYAYDWQTLAIAEYEGHPLPLVEFYGVREVRKVKVYTPRQVARLMCKTEHWGPWEAATAYPHLTAEAASRCFAFDEAER